LVSRRAFLAGLQVLRTDVPLVLAPATVEDGRGRPVRGLGKHDFALLDDGVPRVVEVEEGGQPVSLVLAAQATVAARKPLQKLREVAGLFEPLVAGEGGEAALLAIRDEVTVEAAFTADWERIVRQLRHMEARGAGLSLVDAAEAAASLCAGRPRDRRRILLIVAEDRDRTSRAEFAHVLERLQREQVTVYALTWSPFLMEFGREAALAP